jgi:hypothetical protein
MPTPTRDQIARRVMHNLSIISGVAANEVTDSDKQQLTRDLGLTEDMRGALAPGFQKIARQYVRDTRITKAECKALKTTKAAIDVVFGRAGGIS